MDDISPRATDVLLAVGIGLIVSAGVFAAGTMDSGTSYVTRFTETCTAKNGVTVVSANPGPDRYKCVSKEALIAVDL